MKLRVLPFIVAPTLMLLAAARADAAAPDALLLYTRGPGAESCPDEDALRRAVAARLERDPFVPRSPLSAIVEVTREHGHLLARIVLSEKGLVKGTQTLAQADGEATADCEDLVGAIALTISVALDARSALGDNSAAEPAPSEGPRGGSPEMPPPPPASPPPRDASPPSPPAALRMKETPQRIALWIAPGARASVGAWPSVTMAASALVELRSGLLGFGIEGRYDLPSQIRVGEGQRATVERVSGAALLCAHPTWLAVCGIAAFGNVHARGDVAGGTSASGVFAAWGGRVGLDAALGSRVRVLGTLDVTGIATPMTVTIGANAVRQGGIEGSAGIAMLMSIF